MYIQLTTPLPLTTPELLEPILANLPPRVLLLAQRVCKKWHTLITTSPTLQSLLYFRRAPPPSEGTSAYTLNPLLEEAFPFLFNPEKAGEAESEDDWDIRFGDVETPATIEECVKPFFYSSFNRRKEAWRRKEASWRNMHITVPPTTTVVFRTGSTGMFGVSTEECVIDFGPPASPRPPPTTTTDPPDNEAETPYIKLWTGPDLYDIDLSFDNISKSTSTLLDPRKQDGLRTGLLYDYLFSRICTGNIPVAYALSFARGRYPSRGDVAAHAAHSADISLEALIRPGGGTEAGLTMLVDVNYVTTCLAEWDERYPQFRSERYRYVDVGPMVNVKTQLWD